MVVVSNGENSGFVPRSRTLGANLLSAQEGTEKAASYESAGVDERDISLVSRGWAWHGGIAIFPVMGVNSETTYIDRLSLLRTYS